MQTPKHSQEILPEKAEERALTSEILSADEGRPRRRRGNPAFTEGHSIRRPQIMHRTLKRRMMKLIIEAFDQPMAKMLTELAQEAFEDFAPELLTKARAGDREAREILLQATLEPRIKRRRRIVS